MITVRSKCISIQDMQGHSVAMGERTELQAALAKKRKAVSAATHSAMASLHSALSQQVNGPTFMFSKLLIL